MGRPSGVKTVGDPDEASHPKLSDRARECAHGVDGDRPGHGDGVEHGSVDALTALESLQIHTADPYPIREIPFCGHCFAEFLSAQAAVWRGVVRV